VIHVIQQVLAFEIFEFPNLFLFHKEAPHPEKPGPELADVGLQSRIPPVALLEMLVAIQLTHQPGRKSHRDAGGVEGFLFTLFAQSAFQPEKPAKFMQGILAVL